MKNKILSIVLAAVLLCIGMSGCAKKNDDSGKIKIVTTIFPAYDFARACGGEDAAVKMLLTPGMESHGYESTPKDIVSISECDLFIYNGGESDAWVEDVLHSLDKCPKTLKMTDCVTTVTEKIVEGMEGEEDGEIDEHVWTSPKNAIKIVQGICANMCIANESKSESYEKNALAYIEKITALDKAFESYFSTADSKTMVFGDRFPLRYFADEYGLTYYAAFPGCASETETSAKTVSFLINKVKSENIKKVFYIEFSNHSIADTIASSTGAQTALFHSCHNVSKEDFENGETYVSLMNKNLEALCK